VVDLRGSTDSRGRELHATEVAVADEVAAAAELAMGKAAGIPAAIVRGLDPAWFRESTGRRVDPPSRRRSLPVSARTTNSPVPAFIEARRSIRAFTGETVDQVVLDRLVEAACLAPAPHHSRTVAVRDRRLPGREGVAGDRHG